MPLCRLSLPSTIFTLSLYFSVALSGFCFCVLWTCHPAAAFLGTQFYLLAEESTCQKTDYAGWDYFWTTATSVHETALRISTCACLWEFMRVCETLMTCSAEVVEVSQAAWNRLIRCSLDRTSHSGHRWHTHTPDHTHPKLLCACVSWFPLGTAPSHLWVLWEMYQLCSSSGDECCITRRAIRNSYAYTDVLILSNMLQWVTKRENFTMINWTPMCWLGQWIHS